MLPRRDTSARSHPQPTRPRHHRRNHHPPIRGPRLLPGRCAMSSPGQPSVPAPVPARLRRRSFGGPFVLIVLGIVFLLGNLHLLSWARLGSLFAHYWPALLILWGV